MTERHTGNPTRALATPQIRRPAKRRRRPAAPSPQPDAPLRALVIFVDETDLWYLRGLKAGFRHCFLALNNGYQWIALDPMAHQCMINALPLPSDFDLADYFRAEGHQVIETTVQRAPRQPAPMMPFTCVETVKRVLGIHNRRVITPHQLYRHLQDLPELGK